MSDATHDGLGFLSLETAVIGALGPDVFDRHDPAAIADTNSKGVSHRMVEGYP